MDIVYILLAVCALFFLWVCLYDTHRFVTVCYTLVSDKIKRSARLVVLSDLHNKQYGKENEVLLQAVEELKPEAILVAGDMITAGKKGGDAAAVQLLAGLAKICPIYYANGNHEQKLRVYSDRYGSRYGEYLEKLTGIGIEPLINRHIDLPELGIAIFGSEIDHEYYQRFHTKPMAESYLEELLGTRREDLYTILLAHNPDYFPEYARWGAELVLSGHVHGGLVRIPGLGGMVSPAVRFFPKYDGGLFEEKESTMIISRGMGTHSPDIRIFNPAELIVLELQNQNGEKVDKIGLEFSGKNK